MSRSRQRLAGAYYHVVRRCHERTFRLRPEPALNGAVAVTVARACEKTGVQVLAMCWMSDHYHAVVYDPRGRLSDWMAHVHGVTARYCNAVQERSSHLWDAQAWPEQRLGDLETVVEMVAYVIANPVAAGQVSTPSLWPGVCTRLSDVASVDGPSHERPSKFFSSRGVVPEVGTIVHACPPGVEAERFRSMVAAALEPRLKQARAKFGGRFAGADAVRRRSPFEQARSPEARRAGRGASAVRRFLAATAERVDALLTQRAVFLVAYERARQRMLAGVPHTAAGFPPGTWKIWRRYGAQRGSPGAATAIAL